jgi:uncharacterized protein GlcG (DUF336 family)
MSGLARLACATSIVVLLGTTAQAQAPAPSYGAPVSLEQAMKLADAAQAEAKKNNWNMAIAIVDPSGLLVHFRRMDDTATASINIAMNKARSAAMFKRPTAAFNEAISKGNTYLLNLEGASLVPGGIPIVAGGKIVGAIGISGATGAQDTQAAQAAIDSMK